MAAVGARLTGFDRVVGFNKMPGLDWYYAADGCLAARYRGPRRWLPRYRSKLAMEAAVFDPAAGTGVLSISPLQRALYQRHYGTPDHRFVDLPPGIRRDRALPEDHALRRARLRTEMGIGETTPMLLFVGSGFRTKGLDRAIRALARLPEETRLFVVGDDNAGPYQRLARRLKVDDRVRFMGGQDNVPDWLWSADLLLHPAYAENTGTVLLEAAVAGLPVLTTRACGYAGYIGDGGLGRVLDDPDGEELAAAATDLLARPGITGGNRAGASPPRPTSTAWWSAPWTPSNRTLPNQRNRDDPLPARRPGPGLGWPGPLRAGGAPARRRVPRPRGPAHAAFRGRRPALFPQVPRRHRLAGNRQESEPGQAADSGALSEVRAIRALENAGVATLSIAGYGQRGGNPARRQSFLVTDELMHTVSLEELGERWRTEPGPAPFKWALIRRVGEIAKAMHDAGVNHRDFYLGHFLIARSAVERHDATAPLHLIDLHRSQVRARVPRRWRVKDIGGLYFSTARLGLTRRDLLRFVRAYTNMPLRDALPDKARLLDASRHEGERIYRRYFEKEPGFPLPFSEHPGKDI